MHASSPIKLVTSGNTATCTSGAGARKGLAESPTRLPVPAKPTFVEIFAQGAGGDAAAAGFVLSRLRQGSAPVLWVQDRMSLIEAGRPFAPGLSGLPGLIHVAAPNAASLLWTMEEGLRCAGLAAVVGELWGNPAALGFTATRRLASRAEAHGVPAFLLRFSARPDLSGARQRWRVASAASPAPAFDARAPGPPRWSLELFRARGARPGRWTVDYDRAAHRLDLAAAIPDRIVAAAGGRRAGFG